MAPFTALHALENTRNTPSGNENASNGLTWMDEGFVTGRSW